MKKLVVLAAMITVVASLATAEIGLAVGAKGVIGLPLGTKMVEKIPDGFKQKVTVNGGGAAFVRYELPFALPLDSKLGVQLDIGFNANNGGALENKSGSVTTKQTISFNTLDIPLLIAYRLPVNDLLDVRVGVGPNFGIVVGKMKQKLTIKGGPDTDTTTDVDIDSKVLVGLLADVGVGINLGPGALLADIRFLNDFSKLKTKVGDVKTDVLTRRNLSLSVGYEMKF